MNYINNKILKKESHQIKRQTHIKISNLVL